MHPVFVVCVCLLLSAPHVIHAQRCTESNRVLAEEPVRLADFVALLSVPIPDICGDFNALELIPCRDELSVLSGCCVEGCKEVFEQFSTDCLQELTEVLCRSNTTSAAVPLLNSVASRCDEDPVPLTCGEEEENESTTPESGESTTPESGEGATPEGSEGTPPEGGVTEDDDGVDEDEAPASAPEMEIDELELEKDIP